MSIVRHSRRRFSNYVGTRAPIRMKKRRRTPPSAPSSSAGATSPQDDRHQYTCCCTHVSSLNSVALLGFSSIERTKRHRCVCESNVNYWITRMLNMFTGCCRVPKKSISQKQKKLLSSIVNIWHNDELLFQANFNILALYLPSHVSPETFDKFPTGFAFPISSWSKKYVYWIVLFSFLFPQQRFKIENEKPIQKSESAANNVSAACKKGESPLKPLVSPFHMFYLNFWFAEHFFSVDFLLWMR